MTSPPIIELQDIEVSFGTKKILDGFSLVVNQGERLSLVGESSSGKSTLLKVMVGLIKPHRGLVKLFGKNINTLSTSDLGRLRQRIGMQFQSSALFDSMSILENLKLARRESATTEAQRRAAGDREEPSELLISVGLAGAIDRQPFELSGGMRKRAALARALTTTPDIAFFDDPTAGLDPVSSRRIIDIIKNSSTNHGTTMLLSTTDVMVAYHFSQELVILNQGRMWARDSIETLHLSTDQFVQSFLSRILQTPSNT